MLLEIFLTRQTPYVGTDPVSPEGMTRRGRPSWSDEDFRGLMRELGYRGYGWIHPEDVKSMLEKMAASWRGPRELPRV